MLAFLYRWERSTRPTCVRYCRVKRRERAFIVEVKRGLCFQLFFQYEYLYTLQSSTANALCLFGPQSTISKVYYLFSRVHATRQPS